MKYCKGCGIDLQYIDKNLEGYSTNKKFIFCKNCFVAKNYGKYEINLKSYYTLKKINEKNVFMVIDVFNPWETIIENINNYVLQKNLIIIINKIDILPKSLNEKKILKWIIKMLDEKKINYSKIFLVSSYKKINIDKISNFILKNKLKNNVFLGFSNVGKSSIINSLFLSKNLKINNLIINSIGTTKKTIKLNFEEKIIEDCPGILLKNSYQNIMNFEDFKKTSPKNEIKIKNFQMKNEKTISIDNYAFFSIKESEIKIGYQFLFSNRLNIKGSKYKIISNIDYKTYNINEDIKKRYDLIISGLGIITFKYIGQNIKILIPKNVNYKVVESMHN